MTPYSELLKDPRWQKKRLKVLEYAKWRCQFCGNKNDRTLHVHHSYYTRGKTPWQYPDGSLVALCDACHHRMHPDKPQPRKEPPRVIVDPLTTPTPDRREYGTNSEIWEAVCERVRKERPLIHPYWQLTTFISLNGETALIGVDLKETLALDLLDSPHNRKHGERLLSEAAGRTLFIKFTKTGGPK